MVKFSGWKEKGFLHVNSYETGDQLIHVNIWTTTCNQWRKTCWKNADFRKLWTQTRKIRRNRSLIKWGKCSVNNVHKFIWSWERFHVVSYLKREGIAIKPVIAALSAWFRMLIGERKFSKPQKPAGRLECSQKLPVGWLLLPVYWRWVVPNSWLFDCLRLVAMLLLTAGFLFEILSNILKMK